MSYFEVMTPNLVTHNKCVLEVGWDTLTDEFVFQFEDILNKCAAVIVRNKFTARLFIFGLSTKTV